MRLSIIIPAYNAEKFLKKCVQSCENQDISKSEYEIIIVNDGSTDSTLEIARSLEKDFDNIFVINQLNAGLSVARNEGFNAAHGDYIWFVDSDDWIRESCLSYILNLCESNSLDCLKFCAANVCESKIQVRFHLPHEKVVSALDVLRMPQYTPCAPFSIYRKNFLQTKHLQFYPGILHEDNEFTPRCLCEASLIMTIDKVLYYVYQNPNSITRTFNPKKATDLFLVAESLHKYAKNKSKEIKQIFSLLIASNLNSSLKHTPFMTVAQINHLNDLFYENRYLLKHFLRSKRIKYFVEGFFYVLFPKHVVRFFGLFRKLIR